MLASKPTCSTKLFHLNCSCLIMLGISGVKEHICLMRFNMEQGLSLIHIETCWFQILYAMKV